MRKEGLASSKLIIVMDTAGFLARLQLHLFSSGNVEIYTTNSVIEEVKDSVSKEGLEIGLEIDRVKIVNPSKPSKEFIVSKAREIGCLNELSETDIDVASLAYEMRPRGNVIVFTDDYTLQNLLLYLNIPFKTVKTRGVSKPIVFKRKCKACGYPLENGDKVCPRCGFSIER